MTGPSNWDAYLQPVSPELRRLMGVDPARRGSDHTVTVYAKGPDGKPVEIGAALYPRPVLPAEGLQSLVAQVSAVYEFKMSSVKIYRKNLLKAFGLPPNWQPNLYSPTPRIHMNATLRSISKKLMRMLTSADPTQGNIDTLLLPKSEAEVKRWEAQLGVPEAKFKMKLAELAQEGFRQRDDYANGQRRQARLARNRRPRNSGSLKRKQARTRASMTAAKGRVGHSRNRAKAIRGGRA